jgi:inorganic pyrophosphatase
MNLAESQTDPGRFWTLVDEMIATSVIVIDRPGGSAHPRVPEVIYPFDYGYLSGTSGGDGDGIDVWRGSLPELRATAAIATIDLQKRDAEIKLLIGCTAEEIELALRTHCRDRQYGVLISRVGAGS